MNEAQTTTSPDGTVHKCHSGQWRCPNADSKFKLTDREMICHHGVLDLSNLRWRTCSEVKKSVYAGRSESFEVQTALTDPDKILAVISPNSARSRS